MRTFILIFLLGSYIPLSAIPEKPTKRIGIDYSKLGSKIDLDIPFVNESGKTITFREISNGKPIVLALVYYKCTAICSPFLNGVADLVNMSPVYFLPGEDYTLVTLSFNELEDHILAKAKKTSYIANLKHADRIDPSKWYFLTGKKEQIEKLTDSVGFYFERDGDGYKHASSLIVISQSGLISRYMRGLSFLPTELLMAVTDAREDKWAPTIKKIVKLCFVKDPEGRGYYFDFLKITGILMLISIFGGISLLTFLVRRKQTHKKKRTES